MSKTRPKWLLKEMPTTSIKFLQKCCGNVNKKKTMTHMKYDPQKIVNAMEPVESGTMLLRLQKCLTSKDKHQVIE